MTLGAALAGIEVRAAVELHPASCATYRYNHPTVRLIQGDIRRLPQIEFGMRDAEVVVFGGPPCQGFSTSNQRTRHRDNPGNWLFLEFFRIIDAIRPEWVVFENVAGILQTDRGSFAATIKERLCRTGYKVAAAPLKPLKPYIIMAGKKDGLI